MPLALDQAIALAVLHHSEVRQAELSLRLAELELEAAWARSTVPSIGLHLSPPDLSAEGFAEEIEGTFGVGVSLPWGTKTSLAADLGLSWNRRTGEWGGPAWGISCSQRLDLAQLDVGFAELAAKQQAMVDAQFALEEARNTVVLDTIEAYSDLLFAKAQLVQAERDLKQAEANRTKVEEQVRAGIKAETSLLEAELDLLDAQIAAEQAETTYATDKDTFGRITLGIHEDYEPVAFELRLDELTAAASALLRDAEVLEAAILTAREVQAAQERLAEAREALRLARAGVLPELSIGASVDETGWRISWGISFDLFAPDRFFQIDIAMTKVGLAEAQLEETKERVRNSMLDQQAALRRSLKDLERLPLEEERWGLKETVLRTRFEAGTINEQDWEEFLAEKQAFDLAKERRATSLFFSYLSYRNGLGLRPEWEEWLR